jgi:hypothetical protein
MIFLVSISWISLLHVNTVYGMPDQGTGNATTQELTKDKSLLPIVLLSYVCPRSH